MYRPHHDEKRNPKVLKPPVCFSFFPNINTDRYITTRSDWPTATHLLETLKPSSSPSAPPLDAEMSFIQHDTYIEYLVSTAQFPLAHQAISALAQSLKEDNADVHQRVSVLLMQAGLWLKVGKPERGFSVALRAASVSFRARLGFALWHAVACLGAILNSLAEYREARRLVEGVLPQVCISTMYSFLSFLDKRKKSLCRMLIHHQALEGGDNMLIATLYSHLADSYMGLVNPDPAAPFAAGALDQSQAVITSTPKTTTTTTTATSSSSSHRSRAANIAKAELYIERAGDGFKKAGYLDGECEQLMKKAVIAKLRGDEQLAEEWAMRHNRVWEEGLAVQEG